MPKQTSLVSWGEMIPLQPRQPFVATSELWTALQQGKFPSQEKCLDQILSLHVAFPLGTRRSSGLGLPLPRKRQTR